jgi:PAS domain S-box-containing protein
LGAILKIGYEPSLPGLEKARIMVLNGLTAITCVTVVFFSIGFKIIGYQYYLSPLYIIPPGLLLLFLNKKKRYQPARIFYAVGSLLVISFWCYEGRGNGNEYILIGVAVTSAIIFNNRLVIYLINFACIVIFVLYKSYHLTHPFFPDPALNYDFLPMIVVFATVGVISYQMAFFRDLAHHYDKKLLIKYHEMNELSNLQQETKEELITANEELTTSNEKLFLLTNQLEVIVKQKSAELQSYLDAINVNIQMTVTDPKGVMLKVNEPLISGCGYAEEELLGKNFNMLRSNTQGSNLSVDFEKTAQEGKTWRGEIMGRKSDGSIFWIDAVVLPVRRENDFVNYFLILSLPITERKLYEQAQAETMQLIETVAFRTSHNIRGPLTRIQGLVNLVQKDFVAPEEFKWVVDKILDGSQEIDQVTTELVDFLNTHKSSIEKDV